MKVCFVSPYAYPLFAQSDAVVHGGAEVQIYNVSRYLAGVGHDVSIVVGDFGQAEVELCEGVRLLKASRVTGCSNLRDRLDYKIQLIRAVERSQSSVVLTSCAGSDVGIIASFCRLRGKRFIYRTAQEIECNGQYERVGGLAGRLFGLGLKMADAIVTQSDLHRRLLSRRGLESVVIRNAFTIGDQPQGDRRDIDGLWIGRCDSLKNPSIFLDLVELMPHRRFAMISPRHPLQPSLFNQIRARAESLPNLHFVESIPYRHSQAWYGRSRLLIGTSDSEGFPNTYVQACLEGTPIVSLNVDPADFISRHGAGIVGGGTLAGLRDAVDTLLSEDRKWSTASYNAWHYARANHDIEIEGQKWSQLLTRIARSS